MKPTVDLLPYLPAFVAVVEEQSFKKAAQKLAVTTAAVSKAVQKLEEALGAQLIERTTRSLAVTRVGHDVYARFRGALVEIAAARAVVDRARTEPQGELVVHVSPVLSAPVMTAMTSLCAQHPLLRPRIAFSDRHARFLTNANAGDDEVDVAVRLGDIGDDRLYARKLGTLRFVIVASPDYLARRGTPTTPDDVKAHDVVAFAGPRGALHAWKVGGAVVDVVARVVVDSGVALPAAALCGLGLVHCFDFMVAADVKAGRLVRLFADRDNDQRDVHAVTTTTKAKTRGVRAAIAALQGAF